MNDINEQPSTQTVRINLTQLTISPEFQVRHKLDKHQIKRYENVIKSGVELPPVKVALVEGVYILLDGFHRVTARENLGAGFVEAEVVTTTRREAKWLAASANLKHGLPLKASELRVVFQRFIEARQHSKGRGRLMSYREIGQVIGKSHNTIRNWMEKDFPKLFQQYSAADNAQREWKPDIDSRSSAVRGTLNSLHRFRERYRAITSPTGKREVAEALATLTREMLGDDWEETVNPVNDDF
jgi:hypothetical protein